MISENLSSWLGRPVVDFIPGMPVESGTIFRLRTTWDGKHSMAELVAAYIAAPGAAQTTALVIGTWTGDDPSMDSSELVQMLAEARQFLPKLEALFFGDIISEENEISWITHSDVSPLLAAYPALKHFVVRGSSGLSFGGPRQLPALESLAVQTGGLPQSALREVLALDLPNLQSLDLWLGTDEYGWDGTVEDLQPLLAGVLFPALKHLGLRNSSITNEIAEALVAAPVLERLDSLDLSLGTLTDEGAEHLVYASALTRLKRLDLHHHYCTAAGMRMLQQAFPQADLNEQQDLEEDYGPYVAVGE